MFCKHLNYPVTMLCLVCEHVISVFFVINLILVYFTLGIDNFISDIDDFKSLLLNGKFVDKSLLIHEILKRDEKVFQITRPMQWGKTVNLEMLKTFFEIEINQNGETVGDEKKINPLLITGGVMNTSDGHKKLHTLKISGVGDAMKHMGRYPVVVVNLKHVKVACISEFEESLKKLIVDLFAHYPFVKKYMENSSDILDDDEKARLSNFVKGNLDGEYLFDALEFLSMILYEHFHSYVCLFIDDYDIPLINAYLNFGSRGKEFEYMVEVFKRIYGYTFKENQYLFKAIITGTLNFDIVPSGMAEFEYKYILYNSVLDKEFSNFYGLLEEELNILKINDNDVNLMDIQKWYGGFFKDGVEIYNFGSVNLAVRKCKFGYHLLKSAKQDVLNFILDEFLTETSQDSLHLLSDGKEIIRDQFIKSFRIKQIGSDMFSILVQVGFLSLKSPQRVTEQPVWRMKIPNLEIRGVFSSFFKFVAAQELNITVEEYNNFTSLLFTKNIQQFGNRLQNYLLNLSSFATTKRDEHIYHNLMSNIAASLGFGYLVDSIKEPGSNRGEILVIPLQSFGDCAFNIEYTVCTPWQPLEQIVHTSLEDMLHRPIHCVSKIRTCQHVSEVVYVAIGFCGQTVTLKYKAVKVI